jgi:hypothetical protein
MSDFREAFSPKEFGCLHNCIKWGSTDSMAFQSTCILSHVLETSMEHSDGFPSHRRGKRKCSPIGSF